ncbi:DMT family transporter [Streptomyces sp. NPDC047085]|uniref:DMT family transporter n=1 Tax=Streptomyces sp. NPDC047085 TaxID=3155140 RepID=UPI00340760ED
MSALALSVLLSFVSAVAYAGGAIVQEQVAVSCPDERYAPLRRPSWWAALALNGLGGVLHVVALAYGPLSLVQPLGALTIVFALPMAALFVGRRAGSAAWRGAIMATAGLAGLLSLVGSAEGHSLDTAQRVAVALVTGGAVVALMVAGRAAHRHPAVRSVLLATGSGIAFGMSSVFTKTVAVDWSNGIDLGDLPSLAVIGVFAVAGVMLSQASYRGGGLAAPLATLTVVNPVLAAAVGILMFGETFRYGTTGTVLALGCGVVAAGGLILLTTERLESTPVPAADGTAGQAVTAHHEPSLTVEPLAVVPRQRAAAETELEEAVLEEAVLAKDVIAKDVVAKDVLAKVGQILDGPDGASVEDLLSAAPCHGFGPRPGFHAGARLRGGVLVPDRPFLDGVPLPGGPAAPYADPASYVPLSASIPVPPALLGRQHTARQMLTPPARR